MDIIKPDSGTITLDEKPFTSEDKDKIGYLPEERGLYKKEKVCDVLRYLAALKGVSKSDADARMDKWLARFDLTEWKDKKIDKPDRSAKPPDYCFDWFFFRNSKSVGR